MWRDGAQPQNAHEFFNMTHSSACNVIERCFGLLKIRWAILRSPSFYPVKTQGRIVTACTLLQNLIRREMEVDPMEADLGEVLGDQDVGLDEVDYIDSVQSSEQWSHMRDNLAMQMYNDWVGND